MGMRSVAGAGHPPIVQACSGCATVCRKPRQGRAITHLTGRPNRRMRTGIRPVPSARTRATGNNLLDLPFGTECYCDTLAAPTRVVGTVVARALVAVGVARGRQVGAEPSPSPCPPATTAPGPTFRTPCPKSRARQGRFRTGRQTRRARAGHVLDTRRAWKCRCSAGMMAITPAAQVFPDLPSPVPQGVPRPGGPGQSVRTDTGAAPRPSVPLPT